MAALSTRIGMAAAMVFMARACVAEQPAIAENATSTQPLRVGASIPSLTLKNSRGESVSLASLHQNGPLVLVFFRGGWCPYCTRHTAELVKLYPHVRELGAELVGISPDDVKHAQDNITKNSIPFPILSDADVAAAKAFGLAFQVDDETLKRYTGFGIDLERASGLRHHALPVPAVFIVDKSGKIVFAHSDPDYRKRLEPSRIVGELSKSK
jgi:peroxiredoxin